MDETEEKVCEFLVGLGIGPVQFEPLGNVCPDFLVDGRIAVEARRLNQNFVHPDGLTEGLEVAQRSIVQWFREQLPKLGPPTGDTSWSITPRWRRPLPHLTPLRRAIWKRLKDIKTDPAEAVHIIDVHPGLRLELRRAEWLYASRFILSATDDQDQGGFIVSEALRNTQLCISEKTKKASPTRHCFKEWWLVLLDTTSLGMGMRDWIELRSLGALRKESWSKVLILSPEFPGKAMEL